MWYDCIFILKSVQSVVKIEEKCEGTFGGQCTWIPWPWMKWKNSLVYYSPEIAPDIQHRENCLYWPKHRSYSYTKTKYIRRLTACSTPISSIVFFWFEMVFNEQQNTMPVRLNWWNFHQVILKGPPRYVSGTHTHCFWKPSVANASGASDLAFGTLISLSSFGVCQNMSL